MSLGTGMAGANCCISRNFPHNSVSEHTLSRTCSIELVCARTTFCSCTANKKQQWHHHCKGTMKIHTITRHTQPLTLFGFPDIPQARHGTNEATNMSLTRPHHKPVWPNQHGPTHFMPPSHKNVSNGLSICNSLRPKELPCPSGTRMHCLPAHSPQQNTWRAPNGKMKIFTSE